MKTVVAHRDLVKALAVAGAITPKSSPSLITTHVRIAWLPGKLTAMGTNYESWAYRSVPAGGDAESDAAGEVIACVPAETVRGFVATLPDELTTLTIERRTPRHPGGLRIRCGRSTAFFQALPETDFPLLSSAESANTIKFSLMRARLHQILFRTVDAASVDSLRPYLEGVHVIVRDGQLIAEAANQASLMRFSIPTPVDKLPPIIIPTPAVETLLKLIGGDPTESIDLTYDPGWGWLGVSWDDYRVQTRLLGNRYADLDANLPGEPDTMASCDAEALVAAARRMLNLMAGKLRRVDLVIDRDHLELKTAEPAISEGEDSIEADISGPTCSRRVMARELIDVLAKTHGRVHLEFANAAPDRFRIVEPLIPGWFAVVMVCR